MGFRLEAKVYKGSGGEQGKRVEKIYLDNYNTMSKKTDRLFVFLFLVQWILGILFAVFISPTTWLGEESQIHLHVYLALFLGALLALFPIYLIYRYPGDTFKRYVITISQICFSILFIHLTGGRIETHFHIFGSLAILAFYYEWKLLLVATVITGADHFLRGIYYPQSVYGVLFATPWRAFEHAAWVLFEDVFLLLSIFRGLRGLRLLAEDQAKLEESLGVIETKVQERTRELMQSQKTVLDQQQALITAAKLSALGEMAGNIAHEINNPLAVIKTYSSQIKELVAEEHIEKKVVEEMAESLEKTTDRIAKIIQGLKSLSRDGGSDPFQSVQVKELIEESLGYCKERFKQHGVGWSIEIPEPDLTFEGRAVEISQVILNLLNNSYDAIIGLNEKWVKISAVRNKNWVEISITDSGSGIPMEVQKKLFQPFFTTKGVGKGTGLGLSISRTIIEKHNGTFEIDSTCPNTRFVLRLPANAVS